MAPLLEEPPGLSPLARGTHWKLLRFINSSRFIPAGAGNTRLMRCAAFSTPVYPRWRGEHLDTSRRPQISRGLSPLARGTHLIVVVVDLPERFIPAGAGNTAVSTVCAAMIAVYPRWRGEHSVAALYSCRSIGLSPLARGTLDNCLHLSPPMRFIPAGAGNTSDGTPGKSRSSVYPRWRGEHTCASSKTAAWCGLSPLARGTLPLHVADPFFARFIPAGAGNTSLPRWDMNPEAVYPRWRGEHI
ncbi:Domain of uncharacterised function (DUF2825) [Klebsiella pneumoniae]|nr:Domain of uncharacterised function (DUF2825) [Klebsiella pneumoniae]